MRGRSLIPVAVLSVLVAFASVVAGRAPAPAGADQVSGLQAEATSVSQQLVRQQLEVQAYQQQVSVAASRVAADGEAVTQLDAQITQDQQDITAKENQVRTLAIRSYLDYGSGATGADEALFTGDQEHAQVASEYSAIAVGNMTTALADLHAAQQTFRAHQADLVRQQGADRAEQAAQAAELSQADSGQTQLEALQSRVTGQLAAAVAEQAAAQSAAAAAAVAAAQRSAAKSSPGSGKATAPATTVASGTSNSSSTTATTGTTGTSTTTGASSAPPASGTDPALNPFLQCVVQAESGGDYQAVSPNGLYMGAFQFAQGTWNTAALAAGRPDLVGVPPNQASKADQDTVAVALYALDGERPWLGDRCSS